MLFLARLLVRFHHDPCHFPIPIPNGISLAVSTIDNKGTLPTIRTGPAHITPHFTILFPPTMHGPLDRISNSLVFVAHFVTPFLCKNKKKMPAFSLIVNTLFFIPIQCLVVNLPPLLVKGGNSQKEGDGDGMTQQRFGEYAYLYQERRPEGGPQTASATIKAL